MWDQIFSKEKCHATPPFIRKNFSKPEFFSKISGFLYKIFGNVRQKLFDRKTWYPLLCIKTFPIPIFQKQFRHAHKIFRHCETLSFRRKNVMCPSPFFIRKNFWKPEFFSKTLGFLYKIFLHCEKNKFRRKTVTPLLCIYFFDYLELSDTLKGCLLFFRHCQTWNFWQKNVIPLICINFPDTTIFLKHCMGAHDLFRICEAKIFRRKLWYPLFHSKTVPKRESLSKTAEFNYKNFRHCETKKLWQEKVTHPIMHEIFRYPNFSEHWRDVHEIFQHCETKKVPRKTVTPLLCIKFFDYPKLSEVWSDAHEFFRHCET